MDRRWVLGILASSACTWGTYDPQNPGDGGQTDGAQGADGGAAQVVNLFSGEKGPHVLASLLQNGKFFLFWDSNGNLIRRGDTMTMSAITVCGSNCGAPPVNGILADANSVYWTTGDSRILSCPIGGCSGIPTTVAQNQPSVTMLASDGANLYWTVVNGSFSVMSCAISNCMPKALVTSGSDGASSLAVAQGNVYWTHPNTQEIRSCPLSGCASPTSIATIPSMQGGVTAMAIGGQSSGYFLTGTSVWQCNLAACNLAELTPGGGQNSAGHGITLDNRNVYWTSGSGAVRKCNSAGCNKESSGQPVTIASTGGNPRGIVADGSQGVFWVNETSGTIDKVPPP